jgi:hypothetical protein
MRLRYKNYERTVYNKSDAKQTIMTIQTHERMIDCPRWLAQLELNEKLECFPSFSKLHPGHIISHFRKSYRSRIKNKRSKKLLSVGWRHLSPEDRTQLRFSSTRLKLLS